uniref:Beta strand repeat-containing protein n=1 Tax=Desertifilum tharense IPPAS B-1220 TaxID=1781255 RepID=A0ACD5GP44_9CYAN
MAGNTIRGRDSANHPLLLQAGGRLLLQGNQAIDLFAFTHPLSELIAGGDMVLRSANPVGGDTHYRTGGNFRIEQLDGSLGGLFSPYDPVIRADGDVIFNSYFGNSLHIFAGGSVIINNSITISGSDTFAGLDDSVTLSDGTLIFISGVNRATVDIRAGTTDVNPVGVTGFGTFDPSVPAAPFPAATSADIVIGSINIDSVSSGQVFLTNRYLPDDNLAGNIQVGSINVSPIFSGDGGEVVIDSKGSLIISGTINTSGSLGSGGSVTLLAENNLTVNTINTSGGTNAGDLTLLARTGGINLRGDLTGVATSTRGYSARLIGSVVLDNDIAIDVRGALTDGDVSFEGTVNGDRQLTINTGTSGTVTFAASVGSEELLSQLTVDGQTRLAGTGSQEIGSRNSLTFNGGVELPSSAATVFFTADEIDFRGSVTSLGNNIDLILQPFSEGQNMVLGGNPLAPTAALDIDSLDLSALATANLIRLTIGRANSSGAIAVASDLTFQYATVLRSPLGSIDTTGFRLTGTDDLTLDAGRITTGNIDLVSASGVGRTLSLISSGTIDTSAGTLNTASSVPGAIFIDALGSVTTGDVITSGSIFGNGAINISSDDSIRIQGNITARSVAPNGGAVTLEAPNGIVVTGLIDLQGLGGDLLLRSPNGNLTVTDINASNPNGDGRNVRLEASGDILTGNINTSAFGVGGNIFLTGISEGLAGAIATGNLDSSSSGDEGLTQGGEIQLLAQISITAGQINSSSQFGNGGNVTLDPEGDVIVDWINTQGGASPNATTGTGGFVSIQSEGTFQALSTFSDRNGVNASISTAEPSGGGNISIIQGQPFFFVAETPETPLPIRSAALKG